MPSFYLRASSGRIKGDDGYPHVFWVSNNLSYDGKQQPTLHPSNLWKKWWSHSASSPQTHDYWLTSLILLPLKPPLIEFLETKYKSRQSGPTNTFLSCIHFMLLQNAMQNLLHKLIHTFSSSFLFFLPTSISEFENYDPETIDPVVHMWVGHTCTLMASKLMVKSNTPTQSS